MGESKKREETLPELRILHPQKIVQVSRRMQATLQLPPPLGRSLQALEVQVRSSGQMKKVIVNIIYSIVIFFMVVAIPFFLVSCIFYRIAGFFVRFIVPYTYILYDWQRHIVLSLDRLLDDN